MNRKLGFVVLGLIFGFALARSGASDYDYIHWMFTGENLHLAYLMATAIVVGGIGMVLLRNMGNKTVDGQPIVVKSKPMSRGVITGGALFGLGWGLSGACPGTVLAQIGEGKLLGLFTVAGLIAGTYLYALGKERG